MLTIFFAAGELLGLGDAPGDGDVEGLTSVCSVPVAGADTPT